MQTEKKGFTKREKVLLILMVFIGFTVVMVMYVIFPLNNRLIDETDRFHALEMEKSRLLYLFAAEQGIRESHTVSIHNFDEARERFLNESHISEIGRMLTLLCAEHNLIYIDQRLSSPTVPAEWDAFMVMPVTMTLGGSYDDLMRLLDTVETIEHLRVTRLSFHVNELGDLNRISINFEVIMMQALEG
jgi:hypothetical protein